MSFLQLSWFALVGVLFADFFPLDGFDYGVGMAVETLAHNELERDQPVWTIGPVWDVNEVWLTTAGGAMFVSLPYWYASLFSGYYLILMIILAGLIICGVPFEFRKSDPISQKRIWDWALVIGSTIAPFFLGTVFVSMIRGMPIDVNGNSHVGLSDYFNWFSAVGGIALLLLTYLHGINYIALKATGPVQERTRNYAEFLYWILHAGEVVFALLLIFMTDFMVVHPAGTIIIFILVAGFSISAQVGTFAGHELIAFISSGLTLVPLAVLISIDLFPRVLISSISPKYSILIRDAFSTEYTLTVMTIATCRLLSFVLAYTIWAYWILRERIAIPAIPEVK